MKYVSVLRVLVFFLKFLVCNSWEQGSCSNNYVECVENTSVCIKNVFVCDGVNDCPDGSDELGCENRATHFHSLHIRFEQDSNPDNSYICLEYSYKSEGNKYFSPFMMCDGVNDCENGSDEIFCPYDPIKGYYFIFEKINCSDRYNAYTSKSHSFNLTDIFYINCFNDSLICDGKEDFNSSFDELFCPHLIKNRPFDLQPTTEISLPDKNNETLQNENLTNFQEEIAPLGNEIKSKTVGIVLDNIHPQAKIPLQFTVTEEFIESSNPSISQRNISTAANNFVELSSSPSLTNRDSLTNTSTDFDLIETVKNFERTTLTAPLEILADVLETEAGTSFPSSDNNGTSPSAPPVTFKSESSCVNDSTISNQGYQNDSIFTSWNFGLLICIVLFTNTLLLMLLAAVTFKLWRWRNYTLNKEERQQQRIVLNNHLKWDD